MSTSSEHTINPNPAHVITPINKGGSYRTSELPSKITPKQIEHVLGFKANIEDDLDKVRFSWGFTVDEKHAGIWDYKGSRWSVYDPYNVVPDLFADLLD